jgi:hypothetical protein
MNGEMPEKELFSNYIDQVSDAALKADAVIPITVGSHPPAAPTAVGCV